MSEQCPYCECDPCDCDWGTNSDVVNHPDHYGGESNPYEAIKVIEAWDLNFHLGNVVKYISRAGKKSKSNVEDLKKAEWYLSRYVQFIQKTNN